MSRTLQMPAFCSFTTFKACNFAVLFTAMLFVSLPSKSEQMAFHNMLALSDNELIRHYPANTPYAPESPSNLHPMFEKVGSGEVWKISTTYSNKFEPKFRLP